MSSVSTLDPPAARTVDDLLGETRDAVTAAGRVLALVRARLEALVAPEGRIDRALADEHQILMHGYAWFATTVEAMRQMAAWGDRLAAADAFGTLEQKILLAATGESLAQLSGGVWMAQGEIVRPRDFGVTDAEVATLLAPLAGLIADGTAPALAPEIAELAASSDAYGALGLDDETLEMMRDEFRRFADDKIAPHAHGWHLARRTDPAASDRGDGRARRIRPHDPGGLRRAGPRASSPCASSPRSCRAATSAPGRWGRVRRSPAS